jgi:hypothetical protein
MKELRFSIQCGASNRKALVSRRCSQCTTDHNDPELGTITHQYRRRSHSGRSSSSASMSFSTTLQPIKHRTTIERSSDLDKFDTLLMLAAERTNHLDKRHRPQRFSSTSPPRKLAPLLLVESQQTSNHVPSVRSQNIRSTRTGKLAFSEELNKNNSIMTYF